MVDYPALSGIDDPAQARVALVVNKQIAHVPLSGMGLQPLDATLTALAALDATAGLVVQTGADTFTKRTLTTTANHLAITNPAGTAGDPLLELAVGSLLVGSWTPTLTGTANIAASTSATCYYQRIGAHVSCWGVIQIDPTLAAPTISGLGISLPIASNLAVIGDCAGVGQGFFNNQSGRITADTTNDRAQLDFLAENVANSSWSFQFSYRII